MFSDVQKLKLTAAQKHLDQLTQEEKAMHQDVHDLKDRLSGLEQRLAKMQWQDEHSMSAFRGKRLSTFKRLFTERKVYREYQQALTELNALPDQIAALTSELEIAEMQTAHQIADNGILAQIQAAEQAFWQIERATCLSELGITPAEAVKLLTDNEITPFLDESDRKVFERPREYETKGKAALCAVHKMDIMPANSRLSTLKEANVERTEKVTLDGKEYEYSYLLERDTVHLSMNDEVSSHVFGNWDQCHYTVLQPCAEIANEKIGSLEPNDTFTRGGVDLTKNAWILCPIDEVETVQELNPHVHVLGYKGENAQGLAAPFLSQLGYRAESVGMWGWSNWESEQQFYRIAEREKLPVIQHTDSPDYQDEDFKIGTNKTIALVKMLVENDLVHSAADLEHLQPQLKHVGFDIAKSQMSAGIVANHHNIEVLAEKMQRAGMALSKTEQIALQTQMDRPIEESKAMRNNMSLSDYLTQLMVKHIVRARTVETERSL
ncbi:MAG: hypothetical protein J5580_03170 [Clostridia bacterium]|nr:hypothetical protein [Clostridia bacterium]